MARRYFIADIIGSGTRTDPYRAKAQGSGRHHAALIPTGPAGAPLFSHCLCLVAAADLSPLLSLAGVDAMPDLGLDATLGALSSPQRNQLLNRLQARGLLELTSVDVAASVSWRQLLRKIGRHYKADFLETDLGVPDLV